MKKKSAKYILNVALLIAILAVTFLILFRNQDIDDIFSVIGDAKKGWLLGGIAFVGIHVCGESVILHLLFRSFDSPVTFLRCIYLSCIGFFYSAITPGASGGQPVQVYYMTRFGVDVLIGTLSSMVVTICYKLVLILLCGIFLIALPEVTFGAIAEVPILFVYGFMGNFLFIIFLLVAIYRPSFAYSVISGLIKLGGRLRILKHPEKTLGKAVNSVRQYERSARYLKNHFSLIPKIMGITFFQRLSFFAVCFMVYKSFGMSGTDIFEFIALQVVLAFAVDVLPIPGAAGANESVFTVLFEKIFGEVAVFSGLLLYRGLTYYFLVIVTAAIVFLGQLFVLKGGKRGQQDPEQ